MRWMGKNSEGQGERRDRGVRTAAWKYKKVK